MRKNEPWKYVGESIPKRGNILWKCPEMKTSLRLRILNLYRFKILGNEIQTNSILKILIMYLDLRLIQSDMEY